MPRDLTILGLSALIIMAGACIAVDFVFYCHLTGSDDALDEIADGDRFTNPNSINSRERNRIMVAQPEASKCPHCKGWAFEPEVYPMAVCTVCAGTGRKPDKLPLAKAA